MKKISLNLYFKLLILGIIFIVLIFNRDIWIFLFKNLFPDINDYVYNRTSFFNLLKEHLIIVAISSGFAALLGISLGIFVTRKVGKDFLYVVNSLVSIGQTFPPVAVLAVAVPIVGFGARPTIIALLLYGLLPIVRNTVSGLLSVPRNIIEAAQGMGMSPIQVLVKIELPLSFKVIMAGIRTSTIINIGTATLGATIGAGGFGAPIIEGLGRNPAFVLEGAILVGLFAIIIDSLLEIFESLVNDY
ncbi:MAG: ABC transporter permease [Spirochaetota bacterium]